jgi:hypothetical protein
MLAALRALDAALAEPKVARAGLRREMLAALAAIAERDRAFGSRLSRAGPQAEGAPLQRGCRRGAGCVKAGRAAPPVSLRSGDGGGSMPTGSS